MKRFILSVKMYHRPDGFKAPSVNGAGAVHSYGIPVPLRQIPFVSGKAVLRVSGIIVDHNAIARDLGNDGCGRNGKASAVTADKGGMGNAQTGQRHGINQYRIGPYRQCGNSFIHSLLCRMINIKGIDFFFRFTNTGYGNGIIHNGIIQYLPLFGRYFYCRLYPERSSRQAK